jgi:hypothetical protein
MNTAKKRLLEFLAYLDIGQNAFEKKVGIANGYISHNKGSIGSEIISKISEQYPELNIDWLLNGKGTMVVNEQKSENNSGVGIIGNNINGGSINDHKVVLEMIELLKKKDEQIDRLIGIIEKEKE